MMWLMRRSAIVGAGGEVIGGHAIGAQQCEVFNIDGCLRLLTIDGITKLHHAATSRGTRKRRAKGSPAAAWRSLFFAGEFAHSGVEQPCSLRAGFLTVACVSGSEVAVGQAFFEDRLRGPLMKRAPFGLLIFLVPAHAQPFQALENWHSTPAAMVEHDPAARRHDVERKPASGQ